MHDVQVLYNFLERCGKSYFVNNKNADSFDSEFLGTINEHFVNQKFAAKLFDNFIVQKRGALLKVDLKKAMAMKTQR